MTERATVARACSRTLRCRLVCGLLALFMSMPSQAQGFPNRPIRLVVPSSAGGGADDVARAIADRLTKRLGQYVIVENIAGASGALRARAVARARPDGYTLMVGATSDLVTTPLVVNDAGYSYRSFTHIALVIRSPMVLLARTDLTARSVHELIAGDVGARAKWTMGLGGAAGLSAFAVVALERSIGADFQKIPYQGAAPAMLALRRGEADLAVLPLSVALPYVRGGLVRPLALLSHERISLMPDIPTWAEESGSQSIGIDIWAALVAPAGLAPQIVDTLHRALHDVTGDPGFVKQRVSQGELVWQRMQGSEVTAFIASEHERYSTWARFVRDK